MRPRAGCPVSTKSPIQTRVFTGCAYEAPRHCGKVPRHDTGMAKKGSERWMIDALADQPPGGEHDPRGVGGSRLERGERTGARLARHPSVPHKERRHACLQLLGQGIHVVCAR